MKNKGDFNKKESKKAPDKKGVPSKQEMSAAAGFAPDRDKYEARMKKTIEVLESEFSTIRAGRANPAVLDRITVEYYGSPTPLAQVASISAPEPRVLAIQPWDASTLKGIEKGELPRTSKPDAIRHGLGLFSVREAVRKYGGALSIHMQGEHCVVLSVMILPSIIKVSMTALDAVPKEYEDASLALGATPIETYFRVSVPAAKSGIAAAVVLGVGRAIGEAMAVMMVSGNVPNMPSLFESVRFLTTAVASEMAYSSGLQQQALFSIALVLFLFIMLINACLNFFLKRNKEG